MTDPKTKQAILKMREDGASYAEIADIFASSPNTVKSICYRNGVHAPLSNGAETGLCKNCGKPLSHPTGGGRKIFCSNRCRYQWWNHFRSRQPYRLICYCCGKEFVSFGNKKKQFCGRECYRLSRYGEGLP